MVQLYSKLRLVSIKVHVDSAYERPQHRNSFDTSMVTRKPLEVIGTIFYIPPPYTKISCINDAGDANECTI